MNELGLHNDNISFLKISLTTFFVRFTPGTYKSEYIANDFGRSLNVLFNTSMPSPNYFDSKFIGVVRMTIGEYTTT